MTGKGPYSRVYHSIADDPMFEKVYGNDKTLATWLRMLLIADATYPVSAPMPPRNPSVRLLIASGLIEERPGNRYEIRGMKAERERRSAVGRNAAAMRWQSESNASAMPRRDETSIDKKSNGANASTFMGWRPKDPESGAGLWHGNSTHDGRHGETCQVCFPPSPSKKAGSA